LFKLAFNLRVFQEVDEVVDIDAKGEGDGGWLGHGVGWVDDVSVEKARVRCIFVEAKTVEYALFLCTNGEDCGGGCTNYI
jgi:hypothetical protein